MRNVYCLCTAEALRGSWVWAAKTDNDEDDEDNDDDCIDCFDAETRAVAAA